jgi:hypothetical protein
MFRIKKEQMDYFSEKTRRKFVRRMTAYLRDDLAQSGRHEHVRAFVTSRDAASLEAWVDAAVVEAKRHHVSTEPEAAQLMLLFIVLGLDASDRLGWAREVLTDRDLYAIGKVRRLIRRAREQGVLGIDDVVVYEDHSERRNEQQPEA